MRDFAYGVGVANICQAIPALQRTRRCFASRSPDWPIVQSSLPRCGRYSGCDSTSGRASAVSAMKVSSTLPVTLAILGALFWLAEVRAGNGTATFQSLRDTQRDELDPWSKDCLACHDGVQASYVATRQPGTPSPNGWRSVFRNDDLFAELPFMQVTAASIIPSACNIATIPHAIPAPTDTCWPSTRASCWSKAGSDACLAIGSSRGKSDERAMRPHNMWSAGTIARHRISSQATTRQAGCASPATCCRTGLNRERAAIRKRSVHG